MLGKLGWEALAGRDVGGRKQHFSCNVISFLRLLKIDSSRKLSLSISILPQIDKIAVCIRAKTYSCCKTSDSGFYVREPFNRWTNIYVEKIVQSSTHIVKGTACKYGSALNWKVRLLSDCGRAVWQRLGILEIQLRNTEIGGSLGYKYAPRPFTRLLGLGLMTNLRSGGAMLRAGTQSYNDRKKM